MRVAFDLRKLSLVAALAASPFLYAQQQQPRPSNSTSQEPAESPKRELGPTTSKTKEEIDAERQPMRETVITAAPVDPKKYIIGPEDILRVVTWHEPDFTAVVQVRPDGKFNLPLVGDITAAGLTPDAVATDLSKSLESLLVKPQVSVSVLQVLSKSYYITGEVNRTGKFPLVVPTTIMEALTNAGGFREYAKMNKIVIMRGKDRIRFNYKDVIKGKNLEQNILLQDGDYVHVP
jgi:polysaccharide export outer membrane protein